MAAASSLPKSIFGLGRGAAGLAWPGSPPLLLAFRLDRSVFRSLTACSMLADGLLADPPAGGGAGGLGGPGGLGAWGRGDFRNLTACSMLADGLLAGAALAPPSGLRGGGGGIGFGGFLLLDG